MEIAGKELIQEVFEEVLEVVKQMPFGLIAKASSAIFIEDIVREELCGKYQKFGKFRVVIRKENNWGFALWFGDWEEAGWENFSIEIEGHKYFTYPSPYSV